MPLIDPLWAARIRRYWQLSVAIVVFVVFLLIDLVVFRPLASRYERALRQATEAGMAFDPSMGPRIVPPRVFALLSDNSLPPAEARAQSDSGRLAAALLEELTRLSSKHGMSVIAAEPGVAAQQPSAVQVRAHLKMRCSHAQFVSFLDELSRNGSLISVDRFSLVGEAPGRHVLELWTTRYILTHVGSGA